MGRKEDRGMNAPDKVRQKVTGDPAECISEQKEDLVLLWRQSGAADPLSLRNLELWCRCGHKYRKTRLETSINRNGIITCFIHVPQVKIQRFWLQASMNHSTGMKLFHQLQQQEDYQRNIVSSSGLGEKILHAERWRQKSLSLTHECRGLGGIWTSRTWTVSPRGILQRVMQPSSNT